MRYLLLCILGLLAGCREQFAAPNPLTPEQREAVKQASVKIGAKVTAEVPEAIYLSLRNSHVQIRELGVTIESAPRVQRDIQDFAKVTDAVASVFLIAEESDEYKRWLRTALARQASPVHHSEYEMFKVTLSRRPLRSTFTRIDPAEAE